MKKKKNFTALESFQVDVTIYVQLNLFLTVYDRSMVSKSLKEQNQNVANFDKNTET